MKTTITIFLTKSISLTITLYFEYNTFVKNYLTTQSILNNNNNISIIKSKKSL